MAGTERMTGITIGSDEPKELIFYDKNGRVFDKPKKAKANKPKSKKEKARANK